MEIVCGNGILDPGEICDDGNNLDGDDCRADCLQDLTLCGNGSLDPGEGCDDGNKDDGDGCSSKCQNDSCGVDNCMNGCCDGYNTCLAGSLDTVCGNHGEPCQDCTLTGERCLNQQCSATGDCSSGQQAECGNCGLSTCNESGEWGSCMDEGPCAFNQTDVGSACDRCGHQERTCGANCQWGAWTCVGQGACNANQLETGAGCTKCGHLERTCGTNCQWGAWSCVGSGVCDPNAVETGSTCEGTGHLERTCQSNCQWGGWSCVGGCGATGHMGTGNTGDPCTDPAETWRCVYSSAVGDWASQVCRSGIWQTFYTDPPNCEGCCGDYTTDCGWY